MARNQDILGADGDSARYEHDRISLDAVDFTNGADSPTFGFGDLRSRAENAWGCPANNYHFAMVNVLHHL